MVPPGWVLPCGVLSPHRMPAGQKSGTCHLFRLTGGSSGAHHHPAGWPVSWALGRGLGPGLAGSIAWCPALGAPGTQDSTHLGFVGGRPPFPHDLRYGGDAAKAWNSSLSFQCAFLGGRQARLLRRADLPALPESPSLSQPSTPLHLPHVFRESCAKLPTNPHSLSPWHLPRFLC